MDRFLCDYLNESLKEGLFDNLFPYSSKKTVKKRGMFYFLTSVSKYNSIQKERIKHYNYLIEVEKK